jgi:glutaminase
MIQQILIDALDFTREEGYKGKLPNYIPELENADPRHLGAGIMSTEGQFYSAGDWEQEFTMQSIAKVIILILALQTRGEEKLFKRVGMEPSGDAFNSFRGLSEEPFIPFNPMVNAGAISTAACCIKKEIETYPEFLKLARKLCGNSEIKLDEAVYESESQAGTRNRVMASMLRGAGILRKKADVTLDFYFMACSTLVNTKDLAHLALVLANGGKSPSGKVLLADWIPPIVKTLMLTCGMYNDSGKFAMKVGMPAKSGISGGIIACAENQYGIATFAPAMNARGSSAGGLKIMQYLSKKMGLHMFSGGMYE